MAEKTNLEASKCVRFVSGSGFEVNVNVCYSGVLSKGLATLQSTPIVDGATADDTVTPGHVDQSLAKGVQPRIELLDDNQDLFEEANACADNV